MNRLKLYLFPIALLSTPLVVQAQDWHRAPPREVFYDGNCRVEQFVNRDGDVVERRLCRADRNGDARVARDDDDQPAPRRYQDAPRGGLVAQPGSYAAARNAQQAQNEQVDAPAPTPRYRPVEPVAAAPRMVAQRAPAPIAVKTRVVAQASPVVVAPAPRVAKAPLYVTTRRVASAAPVPAPRVLARTAPLAAPRVVAKAPAIAPRVVAMPAPAVIAPRSVAKVAPAAKPVRLAVRAVPVAPAPRMVAKVQPVAKPAQVIAVAAPVAKPTRVIAVAAPVAKVPRLIVQAEPAAVATRVQAKAEPLVEPRVAAKAEVVGKSPGNYPKSDWLVTLPATEQENPEAAAKAAPVAVKATTGPKPLVAKVEPDWQRHEYREYVVVKSKDRYSNLK